MTQFIDCFVLDIYNLHRNNGLTKIISRWSAKFGYRRCRLVGFHFKLLLRIVLRSISNVYFYFNEYVFKYKSLKWRPQIFT